MIKGLKYLGTVFKIKYDEDESIIYYEHLKDYSNITFKKAIKEICKKEIYLPKLSTLIKYCEKFQDEIDPFILEMERDDFFKIYQFEVLDQKKRKFNEFYTRYEKNIYLPKHIIDIFQSYEIKKLGGIKNEN